MSDARPRWRLVLVVALLLLAPWTAECSWGGFTAAEFVFVVIILAPMYGGAAVLIREVARRTGGGWPAIVLLAAAFGLFQAGLVDQALLDPDALSDTEFAEFAAASRATLVPGLGFSAEQFLDFVGNHIALSICAPIAIVESFPASPDRHRPWLGRPGLGLIIVLYVFGSFIVFQDTAAQDGYTPNAVQVVFVAALVLVLAGAALLPRWRRAAARADRPAVHPGWVGVLVAGAQLSGWLASGWALVGIRVAAVAVTVPVIVVWSRRAGWGQPHVLAAWGAGLLVAAATAYLVPNYAPASPSAALTGDIAISIITVALLVAAGLRLRSEQPINGRHAPTAPPAPGC